MKITIPKEPKYRMKLQALTFANVDGTRKGFWLVKYHRKLDEVPEPMFTITSKKQLDELLTKTNFSDKYIVDGSKRNLYDWFD